MILQGDARAIPLADKSVQCVVTSPPYWGLRDYGVAGQIGLEPTPEAYVATIVQVFREVRRVLRDDGTVWLNLGDSYARAGGWSNNNGLDGVSRAEGKRAVSNVQAETNGQRLPTGYKSKDLVGIPWRVALALQADGWYLRSDIIWAKPNPMPESVTDRPTRSHEYVFLLTKSERYYYDYEAVKETSAYPPGTRADKKKGAFKSKRSGQSDTQVGEEAFRAIRPTRNARSVWTITPKPFKGAHFATFPPELPERCIRAGTPEGGSCAACGAPRKRVIEKGAPLLAQQQACGGDATGQYAGQATKDFAEGGAQDASATKARILAGMVERRTVGWQKTCTCATDDTVPAVVLDPFSGAGTTVIVAERLGRTGIGLELKQDYIDLSEQRRLGHTHRHGQASHAPTDINAAIGGPHAPLRSDRHAPGEVSRGGADRAGGAESGDGRERLAELVEPPADRVVPGARPDAP